MKKGEWKNVTEVLDEVVPFTMKNKENIISAIHGEATYRSSKRFSVRYAVIPTAVALAGLLFVNYSPLADTVYKLFKGDEVQVELNEHDDPERYIETVVDREKEIEKVVNSLEPGEKKAVYVRETIRPTSAAGADGKPRGLVTVVSSPYKYYSMEEIAAAMPLSMELPASNILDYQLEHGKLHFGHENFNVDDLYKKAYDSGENVVTLDLKSTDKLESVYLSYTNSNSPEFSMWIRELASKDDLEIPKMDEHQIEVLQVNNHEVFYLEHGDTKGIMGVMEKNSRNNLYDISSKQMTKEELIEVATEIFK